MSKSDSKRPLPDDENALVAIIAQAIARAMLRDTHDNEYRGQVELLQRDYAAHSRMAEVPGVPALVARIAALGGPYRSDSARPPTAPRRAGARLNHCRRGSPQTRPPVDLLRPRAAVSDPGARHPARRRPAGPHGPWPDAPDQCRCGQPLRGQPRPGRRLAPGPGERGPRPSPLRHPFRRHRRQPGARPGTAAARRWGTRNPARACRKLAGDCGQLGGTLRRAG